MGTVDAYHRTPKHSIRGWLVRSHELYTPFDKAVQLYQGCQDIVLFCTNWRAEASRNFGAPLQVLETIQSIRWMSLLSYGLILPVS